MAADAPGQRSGSPRAARSGGCCNHPKLLSQLTCIMWSTPMAQRLAASRCLFGGLQEASVSPALRFRKALQRAATAKFSCSMTPCCPEAEASAQTPPESGITWVFTGLPPSPVSGGLVDP